MVNTGMYRQLMAYGASRLLMVNWGRATLNLNGNMTWGPLPDGQFASLTYDTRNRLVSVGQASPPVSISYTYDPAGNRIALTNNGVVTRFVVDPNTTLSRVLIRIRPGVTNYYIYGLGLLYEVTETATNSYQRYYHYDYRGSTVALTDHESRVTDRIEYSAYGTITYRTGTTDTPFLFNGRYGVQTDPNGLLYMRARYYNPYICRFINPDPIGFDGGLNWYAYADGNPIDSHDPFGLCALSMEPEYTWLDRAIDVAGGVLLAVGGFVPYVGDILDAYTVVAPGSSALDRTLSGASLGINAWTLGVAPNLGPVKRGVELITEAFTHSHHPIPKFLGGHAAQTLSEIDPKIHAEFHQVLRQNLNDVGIPLDAANTSSRVWQQYMLANPGAQRVALDAVLDASRAIDAKYGTQITRDVWNNVMQGNFTPYP